jgi:hypothetical protein
MAAALPRFSYNGTNIDIATPLKSNNGFDRKAHRDTKFSVSGIQQTSFDFNELLWDVELTFVDGTTKDSLVTMWDNWAVEGKEITFYPDYSNAPGTVYTCTVISDKFETNRTAPGVDYWEIKFQLRKVIT